MRVLIAWLCWARRIERHFSSRAASSLSSRPTPRERSKPRSGEIPGTRPPPCRYEVFSPSVGRFWRVTGVGTEPRGELPESAWERKHCRGLSTRAPSPAAAGSFVLGRDDSFL